MKKKEEKSWTVRVVNPVGSGEVLVRSHGQSEQRRKQNPDCTINASHIRELAERLARGEHG